MKLKSIEIFGFGNYKKPFQLNFDKFKNSKYIVVKGQNGIGKSMLFELISNVLFDTSRGGSNGLKNLIPAEVKISGEKSYVAVEFDHLGTIYKITKYAEENKSDYVEFVKIDDGKETELASGNREAKNAILEFVGLNQDAYFNSVYASQGELLSFIYETPGEARKIIMNLLGLEIHGIKSKNASKIAKDLGKRVGEKDIEIDALIGEVNGETKIETIEEANSIKEKLSKEKEEIQEEKRKVRLYKDKLLELLNFAEQNEDSLSKEEINKEEKQKELLQVINTIKEVLGEEFTESYGKLTSSKDKVDFMNLTLTNKIEELNKKFQEILVLENSLSSKEKEKTSFENSRIFQEVKEKEEKLTAIKEEVKELSSEVSFNDEIDYTTARLEKISEVQEEYKKDLSNFQFRQREIDLDLMTFDNTEEVKESKDLDLRKIKQDYVEASLSKEEKEILKTDLFLTEEDLNNIEGVSKDKVLKSIAKNESEIENLEKENKELEEQLEKGEVIMCEFCGCKVHNKEDYENKIQEHKVKVSTDSKALEKAKKSIEKNLDKIKELRKEELVLKEKLKTLEKQETLKEVERIKEKLENYQEKKTSYYIAAKTVQNYLTKEQKSIKERIELLNEERKHIEKANELIDKQKLIETLQAEIDKLNKEIKENILNYEKEITQIKSELNQKGNKDITLKNKENLTQLKELFNSLFIEISSIKHNQVLKENFNSQLEKLEIKNKIYKEALEEIDDMIADKTQENEIDSRIQAKEKEIEDISYFITKFNQITRLKKIREEIEREKFIHEKLAEAYSIIAQEIFDEAVPIIEALVNKKLTISSKGKYGFYIETKEDGEPVFLPKIYNVKEGKTVSSRSIRTLSGGEAVWVATALRDAKVFLASKRSGLTWEFNINDEIFGSQDQEHRDVLVESVFESNFATQVFFITHVQEVIEKISARGGTVIELGMDSDGAVQIVDINS